MSTPHYRLKNTTTAGYWTGNPDVRWHQKLAKRFASRREAEKAA